MEPVRRFTSRLVPLPINDIDTDQIVPARFLKVTDKSQLVGALFADWRVDANGQPHPDFPLNRPEYQGASVIVAGSNFGCGSSREHAPWALVAEGFRAIISTDFADIFRNNALKNGLLPIAVPPDVQQAVMRQAQEDFTAMVTVDLERQLLVLPNGGEVSFPIDPFARYCLLNGVDDLGFLLSLEADIDALGGGPPAEGDHHRPHVVSRGRRHWQLPARGRRGRMAWSGWAGVHRLGEVSIVAEREGGDALRLEAAALPDAAHVRGAQPARVAMLRRHLLVTSD